MVFIYLLVFAIVVLTVFLFSEVVATRERQVGLRLAEIQKIEVEGEAEEEDELRKPFHDRIIKPFFLKAGETVGRLTPREIRLTIEKKLIYAGSPYGLNFSRFVSLQLFLAIVLFGGAALFLSLFIDGGRVIAVSLLMAFLGFLLPVLLINSKAAARQLEIQRNLPDILDLLLVSVEAGLGFDMALKRVVDQAPGALSREFSKALDEIRIGKAREEALRGIVARTGVADLSSFITAVIQSEQLGTNIANTLRIQANTMRQKRKQRAEQAAMKAPIKMLFPLVFFIFPSLFVVLLGPAVIQLVRLFAEML